MRTDKDSTSVLHCFYAHFRAILLYHFVSLLTSRMIHFHLLHMIPIQNHFHCTSIGHGHLPQRLQQLADNSHRRCSILQIHNQDDSVVFRLITALKWPSTSPLSAYHTENPVQSKPTFIFKNCFHPSNSFASGDACYLSNIASEISQLVCLPSSR